MTPSAFSAGELRYLINNPAARQKRFGYDNESEDVRVLAALQRQLNTRQLARDHEEVIHPLPLAATASAPDHGQQNVKSNKAVGGSAGERRVRVTESPAGSHARGADEGGHNVTVDRPRRTIGKPWRQASTVESADRERLVQIDPEVMERGLRGHIAAEGALAAALRAVGLKPLSPRQGDPRFDIAWRDGEVLWVAEVKSITDSNEERQLRLGLGQVLRYRSLLTQRTGLRIQAALVPERPPTDATWRFACEQAGVLLITGSSVSEIR